jgi:putative transposase
VAESFFATLKKELVHDAARRTRQEARAGLFEYIEVWYYRNRRRPTLDSLSTTEYEEKRFRNAA